MIQCFALSSRKILLLLALFAATLALVTCEEESAEPRNYPRLNRVEVTNVSNKGATFSANLYYSGTSAIVEHGFLWGKSKSLDLQANERVYLGPLEKEGNFRADITTALVEGEDYYVRPFVTSGDKNIYGPATSFKSLGSIGPEITGFMPESGGWGDSLVIFGKNFSWLTNEVFLNDTRITVIEFSDTIIYARIESSVKSLESNLTVSTAGVKTTYTQKKFKLIPPSIRDFSPKEAYWGDTLLIRGTYLSYLQTTGSFVKLGSVNCQFVPYSMSDTLIKVLVPHQLSNESNKLDLNVNGVALIGPYPLTLRPPYFSFSPNVSTWGKTVTLKGRFNTITGRGGFFFNNVPANVLFLSETTVKLDVPASLADIHSNITYKAAPFTVTSTEFFQLLPPAISNFSPVSGPGGTLVTIKGKYFSTVSSSVMFGDFLGSIVSKNDSVIVTKAPAEFNGPVKITVKSMNQQTISTSEFNLTNPYINSFSPLTGTFDDVVTITGGNFTPENISVTLGNYSAQVISVNQNQIVVKVPLNMDSIPAVVKVTANQNRAYSAARFTLMAPVISSVSPLTYTPEGDIIITGQYFNPEAALNKVFVDIYQMKVKSATATQIIATSPASLPRGNLRIYVNTGGYRRNSAEVISVNSQWLRINAPQIKTNNPNSGYYGIRNYGAGLKNTGYVASVGMMGMYRFNPSDRSWVKLQGFPLSYNLYGAGSTVLGDTLYIVGGYGSNVAMHSYDPAKGWRQLGGFNPGQAGILLGLQKSLWFGMSAPYEGSNVFWEINSENNYSYVKKGAFPGTIPASFASYFSAGNRGYVVLTNNQVWQFNPDNLTWTRKNDFPGSARVHALSFVIGSYAYFGAGRTTNSSQIYDDIWRYNYSNDTWTIATKIPVQRYSATVFTIENKVYIGFGLSKEKELYDFYEYDPAY